MANTKLTEKLTAVADAIRAKTGSSEKLTLDQMPAEIGNIQTGGGGSATRDYEVNDVTFYDYDGTIVYSCSMADAQNLTELPTPPEHKGLVFQEWNWTMEQIKSSSVGADVGAMYDTEDGAVELYVRVTDEYRMKNMSITIGVSSLAGSSNQPCPIVEWGDGGTSESTVAITSYNVFKHTYAEPGNYIIRIKRGTGGVFKILPYGSSFYSIFASSSSGWSDCPYRAIFGSDCSELGSYLFEGIMGLHNVIMHKGLTLPTSNSPFKNCGITHVNVPTEQINLYETFRGCRRLKSMSISGKALVYGATRGCSALDRVIVPDSVATIDSYAAYDCCSLRDLKIGNHVWKIDSYAIATSNIISSITIPSSVKQLSSKCLSYMNEIKEYHFKSTEPPALASSDSLCISGFDGVKTKIYVPKGTVDTYKAATNWAALADYIVEEE